VSIVHTLSFVVRAARQTPPYPMARRLKNTRAEKNPPDKKFNAQPEGGNLTNATGLPAPAAR